MSKTFIPTYYVITGLVPVIHFSAYSEEKWCKSHTLPTVVFQHTEGGTLDPRNKPEDDASCAVTALHANISPNPTSPQTV